MPPLPIEVCQAILRHSIYVPGLFDPDAFEGDLMAHGFGDPVAGLAKKSYWGAEKTRKILRQVCWAWNGYLLGFEHRFVNMSDVMHGRVDKMFLKKAMRISFDRGGCSCTKICVLPSRDDRNGRGGVYGRFVTFCTETILPFGFLPAEIVETNQKIIHYGDIIEVMRVLKRARVLMFSKLYTTSFTPSLVTQMANLEHIPAYIYKKGHLALTAQNLVTVSFRLDQWNSGEKVALELPSLRHLRIDYRRGMPSSETFGAVLMPLLQKVGDQLLSLYIDSWDRGYQMPVDIWDKCPNLERFHPGVELTVSAPMSHPLHTLSILSEHMLCTTTLKWHNLRRLIIKGYWAMTGSEKVKDLASVWMTNLVERGVKVEHLNGTL